MPQRGRSRKPRRGILWAFVLRAVGLAGIVYETTQQKSDRPSLLILFGAMIGLPEFLKRDK